MIKNDVVYFSKNFYLNYNDKNFKLKKKIGIEYFCFNVYIDKLNLLKTYMLDFNLFLYCINLEEKRSN